MPSREPASTDANRAGNGASASPCAASLPPTDKAPGTPAVPHYLILGEAYNCYILVQLDDRLLVVDKHAAHERILFDQMCRNMRSREKHSQMLLFPIEVMLTEPEREAVRDYSEQIFSLGFGFRLTGDKCLMNAVPEELSREQAEDMLVTMAGRLAEGGGNFDSAGAEFFERTLWQAACKAAIKGGRVYGQEHLKWICDRILSVPDEGGSVIKTCPHGRPVAFEIKKSSIERQFARIQ